MASLGIGLSRMIGIILLSNTYYLVDIVILKNNSLFQFLPINNYSKYIYAITSIELKTILFDNIKSNMFLIILLSRMSVMYYLLTLRIIF